MLPRQVPDGTLGAPDESHELTVEQEAAYESGLERLAQDKRRALADPGPTWREWFFYEAAKWWVGLGFLIIDAWIVVAWLAGGSFSGVSVVGAALSLAGAVYLEMLAYGYLWHRPSDTDLSRHGRFRPSWKSLREVGRWTPEADRIRTGRGRPPTPDGSPHPDEFL